MRSEHRPSFKVSASKRPFFQRLTPLAWVIIGGGGFLVVLALVVGMMSCSARPDAWQPTPTETLAPTVGPTATAGPSPTPTKWWEGSITATPIPPTPTPAFPVWWADQMTQGEDGHRHLPQEVEDGVWEALIAGLGCVNIADRETIPTETQEELVQQAGLYLADDPAVIGQACGGISSLDEVAEQLPLIRLVEFGPRGPVVCNDRPTRCDTGVAVHSRGAIYYDGQVCAEYASGASAPCILRPPVFQDRSLHVLYRVTLEYDEGVGRWMIVEIETHDLSDG